MNTLRNTFIWVREGTDGGAEPYSSRYNMGSAVTELQFT